VDKNCVSCPFQPAFPYMNVLILLFFTSVVSASACAKQTLGQDQLREQTRTRAHQAVAPGDAARPLILQRRMGDITLDGRLDDPAWQAIEPLPMTMYSPTPGGRLTERTEVLITYDDDFLYVGGRLYDSEPGGIRANTLYRDRYSGDDTFAIILDTFNDNENALWFFTTPLGVRFDMAVSNDGESGGGSAFGSAVNSSWNTFWDVETRQTSEGWFVEMRIPYSSLGFQTVSDRVEMGLTTYRYIARKGERHIFPAVRPDWSLGFAKPSQSRTVILQGVESALPLYVTPYVAGGTGRRTEFDGTRFRQPTSTDRDVGLDVKYNLTSNLTIDATVNTDFAQVEADDQQVNLTRFSLFFPEKRQFFQERSALFNFGFGRTDRLFHSRNIGLSGGEPVRILGGARMVGRVGTWDIGLMNMQTEAGSGLPAENFGVLRLRRRIVNTQSFAGSMFTSRLGDDGSWNVTYGLDGLVFLGNQQFLDVKWTQSFEDDDASTDFFDQGLGLISVERRGNIGLAYDLSVMYAGARYNPGIGFITRRDFTQLGIDTQYGWRPGEASPIRNYDGSIFGNVFLRNEDGSVESARLGHSWDVDFKSSASGRFSVNVIQEDLTEQLDLPENTFVPAGRHTWVEASTRYEMQDGALLRGRAELKGGTFFDGSRLGVELSPTWNASRHLELQGSWSFTRLSFSDRNQTANVQLMGLRAQVGINRKISWNAFIQFNTDAELADANVRFRYNFREGNDFWLVYNESLNTDRDRFDDIPVLPRSQNRTLLFKYTHTFTL